MFSFKDLCEAQVCAVLQTMAKLFLQGGVSCSILQNNVILALGDEFWKKRRRHEDLVCDRIMIKIAFRAIFHTQKTQKRGRCPTKHVKSDLYPGIFQLPELLSILIRIAKTFHRQNRASHPLLLVSLQNFAISTPCMDNRSRWVCFGRATAEV